MGQGPRSFDANWEMEKARSRLKDGKGSLLSRVKKMMGLGGLKSNKKFDDDDEKDDK